MLKNKIAQVWIETVIYTLIAFIIIGTTLAFVKPKIQELQDKSIIEQSILLIKDIDDLIKDVELGGEGNKRKIELNLKKGELSIDGDNDQIVFNIKTSYIYSEPGKEINQEGILVQTEEKTGENIVTLTKKYGAIKDIKYSGEDDSKTITQSPTAYTIYISNKGGEKTIINIEIA